MAQNWIKELVDQKNARERTANARARLLALAALGSKNPTDDELARFTPGQPITLEHPEARPTPGLEEGTPDPALAAELQSRIREEELQRAAAANAPVVNRVRSAIAAKEADIDLNNIALARAHEVQATEADERWQRVKQIVDNPEMDPLLGADIIQKKEVSDGRPSLVKVRTPGGKDVYYQSRRNLDGGYDYTPATDTGGAPLVVPPSATASAQTALQKNAAYIARTLFAGDLDGEARAVEMLTSLKVKPKKEAWAELTRHVTKLNFERYSRDPQALYEKTAELWRVARPMEPIPEVPPFAPPPLPGAPSAAAPGAPAPKPAAAPAPATPEPTAFNPVTGERLVFRNGQWQPQKPAK